MVANVIMSINTSYAVNSANSIQSSVEIYYSEIGDILKYVASSNAAQSFIQNNNKYDDYQLSKGQRKNIKQGVEDAKIPNKKPTTILVGNKKVMVYSVYIPSIECKIVSAMPYDIVFADFKKVQKTFVIAFIIAAAILLIPSILLLRNITIPLSKLMTFMHNLGDGDLFIILKSVLFLREVLSFERWHNILMQC